mmetsp:Transcript_21974/g.37701  ORF Transcript_21974/g.37701 Transcript_21974/m.37701 type:complete len:218 (+) Transcript_21974:233-886(+)|eukprot:CAMPEP_0196651842 /NCGR_PEP_ID=MMETSP1086-20130531/991_1 /TAXON_ID=77921 /ORGANISM="Cyanoptyche  gloeocystis , Strain SAG4.97" /LENGTH=217 /DNA_ID=CAMNT_0041982095 /DNA_START=233 /DNA_END=886 /DNA_ORIENTATION=+
MPAYSGSSDSVHTTFGDSMLDSSDAEKNIVPVLSSVLNQLVLRNDKLPFNSAHVTVFHALKPPSISIQKYLERILKYASCSPNCFIIALIYIDRIIQRNQTFVINSLNIHRLLITSIMVAAKFLDDFYYNNAYYAKVGGVSCHELNCLELDFLFMINFSLNVTPEVYDQYYRAIFCDEIRNASLRPLCGPAIRSAAEYKLVEKSSRNAGDEQTLVCA